MAKSVAMKQVYQAIDLLADQTGKMVSSLTESLETSNDD
jgi:hypothetical protein